MKDFVEIITVDEIYAFRVSSTLSSHKISHSYCISPGSETATFYIFNAANKFLAIALAIYEIEGPLQADNELF